MRLSISGSFCTGKTTLAKDLVARLDEDRPGQVDYIPEVARRIIEMGYPLDKGGTVESYLVYVAEQYACERGARRRHVVSDRSLVDLLSYLRHNRDPGIPAVFERMLEEIVWRETEYFDVYAYCPIEFPLETDAIRPADEDYRRGVDDALRALLAELGVTVQNVSGDRRSRVDALLPLFGQPPREVDPSGVAV